MSQAPPKHIRFPGIYLFASKPVPIFNRLLASGPLLLMSLAHSEDAHPPITRN